MSFLAEWYLWLKALHVIAVIAWMAGLLYLPRLYVYHSQVAVGSEASELFKVMERRLLRAIMNPAMIAAWLFGLLILASGMVDFSRGWIHMKLLLVVIQTGLHMLFARWRREFAEDKRGRPERVYRIFNEAPAVIMVAVVILALVEPF